MSGIGVVIPVYNGAIHLAEAVASVLAQTPAPDEIVVVDDGSTDETPAVAARFNGRIRYLKQDQAGAAAARNHGARLLTTPLLAFLDADDLWVPDKLARQREEMADARTMVFGHVEQFASPELSDAEVRALHFSASPTPAIHPSALLMRTDDFRAVGLFDERLRTGEFIEWYARAQRHGLATRMRPETVMRRRLHRGNHGRLRADLRGDYVRALKSVLDGRRQS